MTCNEPIGDSGFYCMMPAGHGGPLHGMHTDLPEDVTQVIATVMVEAETAIAHARKWERHYKRWTWFFLFPAGALNIIVALWAIARMTT